VDQYHRTKLPNGLRIVSERIPHVRSVAVGIWVAAGSRYEPAELAGVSHFMEHLLFKGTANRTSREISMAIESVGGQLNAFTAKEYTCFYAKVLDEHFPLALEILADMLRNSRLAPRDIANERGVVLEEIKMYEDTPDDLVHVLFTSSLWPQHALGRPVIGFTETITQLTPAQVRSYYERFYAPSGTIVAVAGNVTPAQVEEEVYRWFGDWQGETVSTPLTPPQAVRQNTCRWKQTEQVHIAVGGPGVPLGDKDLYVLSVLSNLLGGGSSSRLFQEIREERGLAYSIYTFTSSYRDCGLFGVYVGTSPD